MTMNCEQFIFETSYALEHGERAALGGEVLRHLDECSSCRKFFEQSLLSDAGKEIKALSSAMSRRLHEAIEREIAARPAAEIRRVPVGRLWLQIACASLVLIASIMGVAYGSHPEEPAQIYAHR